MYIDDIMNHSPNLAPVISNALLYYAVFPLLVSSVCSSNKPIIGINTGLFLLRQICGAITYKPFIESLCCIIFLPHQPKEMINIVEEFPIAVPQYSFTWITPKSLKPTNLLECIF